MNPASRDLNSLAPGVLARSIARPRWRSASARRTALALSDDSAYWHASPVHYYFDESGDFAFPVGRYDVYVQAALICPDSFVDKVEHYVDNFKRALGVDELHGAELPDEQLIDVCRFLGNGPLQLVGQATDTQVITAEQISVHREEQAALLKQNLEQYKRAGGGWAGAEAWYTRHIKRAELASRVSNSEYIQTDMLVGLIHAALFKSLVRFLDDGWRDDLGDFHFILDAKLPGKLAPGEKDLDVLLVPRLGSNPYELVVPTTWYEEPVHPFIRKFSSGEGKLNLNGIFEHGLRFESSHDHAGLQLVDTVAYVTRKAILEPDNDSIHRAYPHIREALRTERDGQALRLVRYAGGDESVEEARYRLVL